MRRNVVGIIFEVIDRLVKPPFNNKAAVLNKGLVVRKTKSLNAGNSRVSSNGQGGPLVSSYLGARCQRHKVVIPLGITCGVKGNSPIDRACGV